MAFRQTNLSRLAKFNSATSSNFIDFYENIVDNKIAAQNAEPKHKTFAPSSFRCPRINWFRLRGVQPDEITSPDRTLDFSANIGTACHEIIQKNLSEALGEDWIDVGEYLKSLNLDWDYSVTKSGYETLIEIHSPIPIRFACDGIIRFNGKLYLLEIKTSEYASFDELTNPKEQHEDQIKCYSTLLQLEDVLVLYQDRLYGGLKCYEVKVTSADNRAVWDRFKYVQDMVDANIAPDRLPKGDGWCTAAHCPYYKKCLQWG